MNEILLSTSPSHSDFQSELARFRCPKAISLSVMLIGTFLQSGCVALNIPSQRHDDPSDGGGILGSWEDPARPGRVLKEILVGPPPEAGMDACDDFTPVGAEFGNGEYATNEPPKPEVPWPKYHPIPTRPVFGE
jgi:hypothetical protein